MINAMNGPVVVGMDGSDEAMRAAAYGAWEAQRRRVPLRLVFAHQPTPLWGPAMLMQDDDEWVAASIHEILTKGEKGITTAHPDIKVETAVISSGPASALVDESHHASLVVIGTRATGGLVGHLSGSVAAQVAAHAHAPVVVLRPDNPGASDPATFATSPVVVGLDGSPESQRALAFAVEEAVARSTRLYAVYAWNLLDVRDIGPIVPDGYEIGDEEDKALRLLTEATEGWSDRCPELIIARRVLHSLDPVDALTKASGDAGLLVVGSRGHGGFLGLRLGSTVDGLIRHAGTPVAVVRGETAP